MVRSSSVLGFLADAHLHDAALAAACRERLTQGYAQLDPALPADYLQTAWRVWVPHRWKQAACCRSPKTDHPCASKIDQGA